MRRTLLTGSLALLALGAAVAPAFASTPALDKLTLAAKTTACTTGEQETSRAATFTGSMPAVAGTRRMQMRFVLVQRLGETGPFARVEVPGWGSWEKSDPGRPGFVFTKRVAALAAPASYRAQITFRWVDRKGHALRTTTRTTSTCVQPDPRPDLVLGGLDIAPKGADQAVYTLAVDDDGRAAAGAFTVTIAVDGVLQPPLTLGPLAAGERGHGTIVGARCSAGSTITVTVDSGDAVDESAEDDDTVQRPCLIG
ncbi:MAG TPA: CARDB domain-containing protein [Baekduia sp.]|uniref:CARDB domain-containing protein n=1 Tax=Baekduia sp. TaxID=2600305 RepID=UPI002CEBC189|nr:CARDB domain-containing protein [Baekduia sp.]HMJ36032.1 CARDB domain-containing protein [Baekduia sp.]